MAFWLTLHNDNIYLRAKSSTRKPQNVPYAKYENLPPTVNRAARVLGEYLIATHATPSTEEGSRQRWNELGKDQEIERVGSVPLDVLSKEEERK